MKNLCLTAVFLVSLFGCKTTTKDQDIERLNKEDLMRMNTPETRGKYLSYLNDDESKAIFLRHGVKFYKLRITKYDITEKMKRFIPGLFHSIILHLTVALGKDNKKVGMIFGMQTTEIPFANHIYRTIASGETTENLVEKTSTNPGPHGCFTITRVPKDFINHVLSETPLKLVGNLTVNLTKEDMQHIKGLFDLIIKTEKIELDRTLGDIDFDNLYLY